MAKITGLGGIFYVAKNVEETKKWYADILGIGGDYGPMLKWSEEKGDRPYSLISFFGDNEYIKPGKSDFMINLRVDNLDEFVAMLVDKKVKIEGQVDEGYGKFAWILDPNGIKIELWQQVEAAE
ncbi:glyoxalase [Sphingorhabdus lutea]|uniref:Glyoxalase n=1 Tax=Sphingorhabdus lutea TaxID=1913578 RepID=A0A1L3JEA4_9SPHN|nr:VOC family protein [Sphingorhabdus lutea]APG63455.1 glyoxalase [Sphingorhabdus lutea]